jgi:hypothetical protein
LPLQTTNRSILAFGTKQLSIEINIYGYVDHVPIDFGVIWVEPMQDITPLDFNAAIDLKVFLARLAICMSDALITLAIRTGNLAIALMQQGKAD